MSMEQRSSVEEIIGKLHVAIYRDSILADVDVEAIDLANFNKAKFLAALPVNMSVTAYTAYGHLATNLETLSRLTSRVEG